MSVLKKTDPFEVPEDNPFQNDKLNRKPIVEMLSHLVLSTSGPFVMAINAPWGTGKTALLEMWAATLRAQRVPCLYFNAWESDDYSRESPMTAFMAEIDDQITSIVTKDVSKSREYFNKAKFLLGALVRIAAPIGVKAATLNIISAEDVKAIMNLDAEAKDIGEMASKLTAQKIHEHQERKKTKAAFKATLEEFAQSASTQEEESPKYPVVFFIDELDRCRPDYAVELLENIKHLFNVPGIIFVLGIDRAQLAHSVKAIYGEGFDGAEYLKRFIDLEYKIPVEATVEYCRHLYRDIYKLNEVVDRKRIGEEDSWCLTENFAQLAEMVNLPIRSYGQCFSKINVIYRTMPADRAAHPLLLGFFLILLETKPAMYEAFKNQEISADALLADFKKNATSSFWDSIPGYLLEAYLTTAFKTDAEIAAKCDSLKNIQADPKQPAHAQERAGNLLHYLGSTGSRYCIGQYGQKRPCSIIFNRIEMAQSFS